MALTCFAAFFPILPSPTPQRLALNTLANLFLEHSFRLFHHISKGNTPFPFLSSVINSQPSSSSLNVLISARYLLTLLLSINCYLFYLLITFFIRPLVKNLQDCIIICFHICFLPNCELKRCVRNMCFMLLFYHSIAYKIYNGVCYMGCTKETH